MCFFGKKSSSDFDYFLWPQRRTGLEHQAARSQWTLAASAWRHASVAGAPAGALSALRSSLRQDTSLPRQRGARRLLSFQLMRTAWRSGVSSTLAALDAVAQMGVHHPGDRP
jgi:hypothetical protein